MYFWTPEAKQNGAFHLLRTLIIFEVIISEKNLFPFVSIIITFHVAILFVIKTKQKNYFFNVASLRMIFLLFY